MAVILREITPDQGFINIGIDEKLQEAIIDNVNVVLSHTEWIAFKTMWDAGGRWCRKEVIFLKMDNITDMGYVRNIITQMRKKLGAEVVISRIGFGYRLNI